MKYLGNDFPCARATEVFVGEESVAGFALWVVIVLGALTATLAVIARMFVCPTSNF